jgi:hypothetical protein
VKGEIMYDTSKDLLDALRAAPWAFEALLHGCTPEQAKAARGGDENWSVCHLRDAEQRALERMRALRDQSVPFLYGYDQESWAIERQYAEANLQEAFAAFKRFRAQHVAELTALTPDGWERAGQHEEQGRITIGGHTLHMVSHDAIHAAQIARHLGLTH